MGQTPVLRRAMSPRFFGVSEDWWPWRRSIPVLYISFRYYIILILGFLLLVLVSFLQIFHLVN
jgi:hypothetical protein